MRHLIIAAFLCGAALGSSVEAEERAPARAAGLPGFEWLLPTQLDQLEDSDAIAFIRLRDDPFGVFSELPADHADIVVIDGGTHGGLLCETIARGLVRLGYRRVYILFDYHC